MSLFEVAAKIVLDAAGYNKGLDDASKKTSSFGKKINDGFKKLKSYAVTGFKVASAAAVAFGVSSIKTGMDFDAAMSQVAATMGKTTNEVKDLRAFAQKMGETTKFSATQAAEALNYMALAGYDSNKAMKMLPNVLNLAAAGNIDLAAASDMVTDAQSALGLSMKQTNKMVDQMAAASSKSNTSVAQLGEAFLTVGGTAKNLKGGTVELSTALGLLADNGVKGAEGGTALRNIILSLSAPTDKAAMTMERLGLEVFDAEGNMRPLNETFGDLNGILSTMTKQEQTEVLNKLFNKVDLKSVNALLGTNAKRWDELSTAIKKSKGAADAMAKTQLDNLAGDVTILKSAFEGLQIAVSDKATPSLRLFVQGVTNGISKITEFIKNIDFTGETVTQITNDILYMIVGLSGKIREKAGEFTDAGISLIQSIAKGISDNGPTLVRTASTIIKNFAGVFTDNAPKIVDSLISGIQNNFPKLVKAALEAAVKFSEGLRNNAGKIVDAGLKLIMSLADGLIKNIPTLIKTVPTIISNLAGIINDNAPKLIKAGFELIVKLAKGIIDAIPTLIKEFPKIIKAIIDVWTAVNWIGIGKTLITGIVNGVKALAKNIPNALKTIANTAKNGFQNINWSAVGQKVISFIAKGVTSFIQNFTNIMVKIGKAGILAFQQIDWKAVGKKAIKLIGKAARSAFDLVKNALKFVAEKAKNAFTEIDWKELGKNVVRGIAKGIGDLAHEAYEAAKSMAKGVLDKIAGTFQEHSPSKATEKQAKYLVEGIVIGIKNNKKYAEASAKELAEAILSASEQQLNNTKVYHSVSLEEEAAYWNEVRKQIKKGTQARIDADKKYYELAEQLQEQSQEKRLNSFLTNYNKILKKAENVASKLKKILKEDGETLLSAAEKWLTNQQVYHDTSLQYEVNYWNQMRKQLKKGTQARIDADKKYYDALNELKEAKQSAKKEAKTLTKEYIKAYNQVTTEVAEQKAKLQDQLEEDLKKIDDDLDDKIKSLQDKYQDAVNNRAKTIKGFFGVLDKADVKVDDSDLLQNVINQVAVLEEWDSALNLLESKLGSESSLYEELRDMGVDGLDTLRKFNAMSETELRTYEEFYDRKERLAERRAEQENEKLKSQLQKDIADLKKTAQEQRDTLYAENKKIVEELDASSKEQMDTLTKNYKKSIQDLAATAAEKGKNVGTKLIEGIQAGINSTKDILSATAQAAVDEAMKKAQNTIGINISAQQTAIRNAAGSSAAAEIAKTYGSVFAPLLSAHQGAVATNNSQTNNNVAINVYGTPGQSITQLANEIEYKLNSNVVRRGTVFA